MKKATIAAVVFCVAVLGVVGFTMHQRSARAAEIALLLDEADQAAQSDSRLAEARSKYDEVSEKDPGNLRAEAGAKFVADRQKALKSLEEGKALLAAGDYDGAVAELKKCFDAGPLAEASLRLGEAYERQRRLVDAQAAYEAAAADPRGDPAILSLAKSRATLLASRNTQGEDRVQQLQQLAELLETQEMIAEKQNYASPELTPEEVASATYDYLERINALSGGLQSQASRARALRLTSGVPASGVTGSEQITPVASRLMENWVSSQIYVSDGRLDSAAQLADLSAQQATVDSPELQALAANPPGSNPDVAGAVVVRLDE